MASNMTILDLPPLPSYTLKPQPSLINGISDTVLSLVLPIVAYWLISGFFHIIDTYDLLPQYRLHTPAELLKRNHAAQWDVFRDVVLQQVIQTIFGISVSYFDPEVTYGKEAYDVAVWARRIRLAQKAIPWVFGFAGLNSSALGQKLGGPTSMFASVLAGGKYPQLQQLIELNGETVLAPAFASWELQVAKFIYWAAIPTIQLLAAIFIMDTWQYFLHRGMHMNHWLYTTLHARHHRLYVPYAYGALYNHPVEGFLLDTLGTGIAYMVVGMTPRQCVVFFTFATSKTVDDHCGYALPWDPLQRISGNNATYHDIHHQSWGIKTNFSQPFLTVWDRMLDTMWKGGDTKLRYEKARVAADKWWEDQKKAAENPQQVEELAKTANGTTMVNGIPQLLPPQEESPEPENSVSAPSSLRRSPRKAVTGNQASLKGLKDRMSGSLPNGVPRMESNR